MISNSLCSAKMTRLRAVQSLNAPLPNTWQEAENAKKASGNEFANMCKSGMTQIAPNGRHVLGQTETGDVITIRPDCTLSYRTFAHEIGHTLGIGEWSNELMNSDGSILDSGLINEYFQQTMMRTERRLTPDNISSPNAYTKKQAGKT